MLQATGASVWWISLFVWPDLQRYFKIADAADTTLFSFLIPDVMLFIGCAIAGAFGLQTSRAWSAVPVWLHAGASAYACLYCWSIVLLTGGDCLIGALLMTPSLFGVLLAYYAFHLAGEQHAPGKRSGGGKTIEPG